MSKEYLKRIQDAAFWSEYHRGRRDNPHEVDAVQVGAAGLIGAHLADRMNPHRVTATQIAQASIGIGYHPLWYRADTTTITGLSGDNKWYGGVLGPDGKIYGIPRNSTSVLIIDGGMPKLPLAPLLSPYLNKF